MCNRFPNDGPTHPKQTLVGSVFDNARDEDLKNTNAVVLPKRLVDSHLFRGFDLPDNALQLS